jgi:hypothetical protein
MPANPNDQGTAMKKQPSFMDLQLIHKALTAQSAKLARQMEQHYQSLTGTEPRFSALTSACRSIFAIAAGDPIPTGFTALLEVLTRQRDGSVELASMDQAMWQKTLDLSETSPGRSEHETALAELDGLVSARAALWREQSALVDLLQAMLNEHGLPLPAAAATPPLAN